MPIERARQATHVTCTSSRLEYSTDNTYARGLKIHPWQSKMKVKSIPEEEELAFVGNQDDYDAEDVKSGSMELETWWRRPMAESKDLYAADGR